MVATCTKVLENYRPQTVASPLGYVKRDFETKGKFWIQVCNHEQKVGDCQLDGNKSLRKVSWTSFRVHFESDDSAQSPKYFGVECAFHLTAFTV